MSSQTPTEQKLLYENAELRARLEEMEETLRAIRAGEVDALVVEGSDGPQVFILQSSDVESNRFRSDILTKVSDAVIAIDEKQHVIYFNAAAERQYGVTASEVLGRSLREVYENRWLRSEDEAGVTLALRKNGQWRGKHLHIKRSGEVIHVESSVSFLRGQGGKPSGLLSVIRDITDQNAAEEALRENQARLQFALESAKVGDWDLDLTTDKARRSVRHDQAFGYFEPVEEWGFQKFIQHVHPDDRAEVERRFRAAVTELKEWHIECRVIWPDRSVHWIAAHGSLYCPAEGEPSRMLGIVFDITERKQNEEMLRTSAAELARADRSKNEFLAMLAHELRNPLAPLRNAVELLQAGDATHEERAQAQHILSRQIENMSRMIDDLLDVSRITAGKINLRKQPVALETILTAAINLVRSNCAKRGQELTVSMPVEPVFLNADPTRLEQVFDNLLSNACKYSGQGSHIWLTAERWSGVEPPEVVIRVRDDGAGIAPDLLPHIFDLFVQATRSADRAQGGLGIGLTLAQRLVKLHGGSVEAHSDGLDRGAEFIVRLPILYQTPPSPGLASPGPREIPCRMLIVDDHMDSARSLAVLQRHRGHEVRTASTGPDALAAAAEFLPDVILLDLGLPGMDGFEVARRLRGLPPLVGTFLVALSGYASPEDRAKAKQAGFDEYMVKPADFGRLREWMAARVGQPTARAAERLQV